MGRDICEAAGYVRNNIERSSPINSLEFFRRGYFCYNYFMKRHLYTVRYLALSLFIIIYAACSTSTDIPPAKTNTNSVEIIFTDTPAPIPTTTPVPSPTAALTPPVLPDIYLSEHLNPIDIPRTYIKDTCEYLKNRWDQNNARPGTVVMIIMLNDINRGDKPNSSDSITVNRFEHMMSNVVEQGFEAINTEQLLGFLESNQNIPSRSVLFLQDGRRTAGNFNKHFRPFWEERGWPVVNSWIIQLNSPDSLLQENLALEQEGFVDHQLYSSLHRFRNNASAEFLSDELNKYTDIFKERYKKEAIAITWPGKPGINFIKAARNLNFQLGFTYNTRGPVMYNWIPQADQEDPERPAYYPEIPFNDPLMTLPRYWPSQVVKSLDQVRLVGKHAVAYAEQNKEIELEYYQIVCAPNYGPIPGTP